MFSILLLLVLLVMAIPVAVLFIQVLSSLVKRGPISGEPSPDTFSVTVLIPAHNEESVIEATLLSIKKQISADDRILVVADNCSDGTAEIVKNLDVDLITRTNEYDKGKGYALGFGIGHINQQDLKPDVIVILDADCTISKGEIRDLASVSLEHNRPVQALYLMHSIENANLGQKVAEFAWLLKNKVRPLGYKKLNLPCQLTGSGMAFPWSIVDVKKFETGNIVEDLVLGIEYALNGFPPFFFPQLVVDSNFPVDHKSEKSQRKRWEHGHLATIVKSTPRLVKRSIMKIDLNCAALALDLLVPPLALLALTLVSLVVFSAGNAVISGDEYPLIASMVLFTVFCLEIVVSWYFFGRGILRARDLFYIPVYVVKKVPLYFSALAGRQVEWVKTTRKDSTKCE